MALGSAFCVSRGQWSCEGPEAQVLQAAAEGTGMVQPGEEEAQGKPYCTLQLPERSWGAQPLLPVTAIGWENGFTLHQGGFSLDIRKNFFSERAVVHWHSCTERWWGHCPWRCSRTAGMWHWGPWAVGTMGVCWWLDWVILLLFSNLLDFVILHPHGFWWPEWSTDHAQSPADPSLGLNHGTAQLPAGSAERRWLTEQGQRTNSPERPPGTPGRPTAPPCLIGNRGGAQPRSSARGEAVLRPAWSRRGRAAAKWRRRWGPPSGRCERSCGKSCAPWARRRSSGSPACWVARWVLPGRAETGGGGRAAGPGPALRGDPRSWHSRGRSGEPGFPPAAPRPLRSPLLERREERAVPFLLLPAAWRLWEGAGQRGRDWRPRWEARGVGDCWEVVRPEASSALEPKAAGFCVGCSSCICHIALTVRPALS